MWISGITKPILYNLKLTFSMVFQDFLYKIDLLGIPITMNLFGREKAKTRLGGVFSFLFLGFVGWAIYNAGYELFRTTDPAVISYEYYRDDPRAITLSRESFPIGFVMQAPTSMNNIAFKDESIFKIQVTHTMARKFVDATGTTHQKWTTSKVYLENCTSDYFGELASGFQSMSFSNSYCISETQPELDKIEIQGVYSSPIYQTITVQVSVCDNTTSAIPCAPEETINEYLSGSWFNAMYVNMVVNPQNYTHPNNTYKDFYYTMVSPANYRETEISLSYVQIDTDSGWLTPTTNIKTYTQVNKIAEFLQTNPDPNGILILCTFKVSQLEQYYTRSYKKLQSVLAEVGGVANSVLVLLIFAGYPFMKMKFRESLMNELFDIRIQKPTKSKRKSRQTLQKNLKSGEEFNIDTPDKTAKLTFSHQKSEVGINLISFPDYKEQDTLHLKSPINSEGIRLKDNEHDRKQGFFLTPQHSSSFILQLPTSQPDQKTDCELASNKTEAKARGHPKTCQEVGGNKPINHHVFSTQGSEPENLEEKTKKINRIKSEMKSLGHKPMLIAKSKTAQPKMKSLHDENSLHLSFSSNGDGSDAESGGKKEDTNQFEMLNLEKLEKKGPENLKGIEEVMSPVSGDESPTRSVNGHFRKQDPGIKKRLDTGLCEYLSWLVKPNRNKYKQAFTEGFRQIDRRLDIINIMKKLREVDKLTTLILDPDQLVLFNNLPKPVIQLKNPEHLRRRSQSIARLESLQFVNEGTSEERIMDSLNTLKNKAVKSKMDKKLIEMFENASES